MNRRVILLPDRNHGKGIFPDQVFVASIFGSTESAVDAHATASGVTNTSTTTIDADSATDTATINDIDAAITVPVTAINNTTLQPITSIISPSFSSSFDAVPDTSGFLRSAAALIVVVIDAASRRRRLLPRGDGEGAADAAVQSAGGAGDVLAGALRSLFHGSVFWRERQRLQRRRQLIRFLRD